MYHKMSRECRKDLKRQFDCSGLELDQMENFMSINIGKTTREILDKIMKDDNLDDRQKVLISYTMGVLVGENNADQESEYFQNEKLTPVMNIKIGQGG